MESYRLVPVAPFIGPRRVLRDTKLLGYDILRESSVIINMHSIYSDPKLYPEPRSFKPERFLDNGKIVKDDDFIVFGGGELLLHFFLFTHFFSYLYILSKEFDFKN